MERGVALAHEAVALISNTDFLDLRGDCFGDLAEVLTRAGRKEESTRTLQQAGAFYEKKGNVVSTERVRQLAGVVVSDAPS